MDRMEQEEIIGQFEYKYVKILVPFCKRCQEQLRGDNSISRPYKCKCGTWRHERVFDGKRDALVFKIAKP